MAMLFQQLIENVGHKVPLQGDELVWAQNLAGKVAMEEARGAMHEASQDAYYSDGGTVNSMFEKLAYFWTHEGAGEALNLVAATCFESKQFEASRV